MDTRIVFMGSPDFALPILNALAKNFNVVGVVTKPDKRSGRGQKTTPPPVKKLALDLEIEIIQPKSLKSDVFQQKLIEWNPDLIVVAAFGKILPNSILDHPPHGCINIHTSLLPRWRGAAPINAAILNGDEYSGVTIMKMAQGLDTGDIISQRSIPIPDNETAGSLFDKLSSIGAKLLIDTIPNYICGRILPRPQNEELSTYAPMLKKEDGLIDPERSAIEIERQIRAFNPWPGSTFPYDGKNLKIHEVSTSNEHTHPTGTRFIHYKKPAIQTSDGIIILENVQKAGKKAISGEDFLRGARDWESKILRNSHE
jgi:methionyl-tRNA formyltransferase